MATDKLAKRASVVDKINEILDKNVAAEQLLKELFDSLIRAESQGVLGEAEKKLLAKLKKLRKNEQT